jgi:hypothetical protein
MGFIIIMEKVAQADSRSLQFNPGSALRSPIITHK